MNIEITARHAPVSDAVKAHVMEKLEHVLRHVDQVTSVHVILDHEKARHVTEVIVHGRQLSATVHADSDDLYASIDRCAEKLKHQLDHHHGRRRDKKRRGPGLAEIELEAAAQAEAASAGDDEDDEPQRIVRTRIAELKPLTVEEARLQLVATDKDFLVFREAESEEVLVLYQRRDGNLGLIETGAD